MSFTLLTGPNGETLSAPPAGGPQPAATDSGSDALSFLNPGGSSSPGFITQAVAGVGAGILKDPLFRFAFEAAFGDDADDIALQQLEGLIGDTTAGAAGRFTGQALALLAPGIGAFGLGGKLAVKAAGAVGARGALGAGAKNIAGRNAPGASKLMLETPELFKKGLVEKAAQSFGGSAGIGGFEAAHAAAEDKPLNDVGKAFMTGFVLTAAFEATLLGAGAAFGASKAKVTDIITEKTIRPLLKDTNTALAKQIKEVEKINNTVTQERAIAALASGVQAPVTSLESAFAANKVASTLAKKNAAFEEFVRKDLPERTQSIKKLQQGKRIFEDFLDDPGSFMSTRETAFNPDGMRLAMSQLMSKLVTTPEGLRGKLGGVAFRTMFKPIAEADQAIVASHARNDVLVMNWVRRTQKNMGLTNKQIKNDPKAFLELERAWETKSHDGVIKLMGQKKRSRAQIDDQMEVFEERRIAFEDIAKPLEGMGAQPLMTAEDLAERGLMEYLPHSLLPRSQKETQAALVKRYGEMEGNQIFQTFKATGLGKFGSFDEARSLKGSLLDKIDDAKLGSVYESNPWINTREYLNRGAYRLEFGKRFGLDGEFIEPILGAIEADAGIGAKTLASNIFDQVMGHKFVEQHLRQMMETATSYQIMTKLGMGVWANMSQTANTIAFGGFRRTGKAFLDSIKGSTREEAKTAVGLLSSSQVAMGQVGGRIAAGAGAQTAKGIGKLADHVETFADVTLRTTGFSLVESNNRVLAGLTGKYIFGDNLKKLAQGRMRGNAHDRVMRQMDSLGITPSETKTIVQKLRSGDKEFLAKGGEFEQFETRAMYRAAQLTQFTPGALRRPEFWTHPVGRIMFQFKSFAMNQGRFMKDQIFAEAAAGNLKPLAYVLSTYPVAGEFVADAKGAVRGKPRDTDGIARVVENFASMGGFGIATNLFASAQFKGGILQELAGPTGGGIGRGFENLAQGEFMQILEDVGSDPTVTAAKFFATGAAAVTMAGIEEAKPRVRQVGDLLRDFKQRRDAE